jgi:hypothetical protein
VTPSGIFALLVVLFLLLLTFLAVWSIGKH